MNIRQIRGGMKMEISITDQALNWFKEEVEVEAGNKVEFNVHIYGTSPIREGYSLAFKLDNDDSKKSVSVEKAGIKFYVEEQDVWFFEGYDLKVSYDEDKEYVNYEYIEEWETSVKLSIKPDYSDVLYIYNVIAFIIDFLDNTLFFKLFKITSQRFRLHT